MSTGPRSQSFGGGDRRGNSGGFQKSHNQPSNLHSGEETQTQTVQPETVCFRKRHLQASRGKRVSPDNKHHAGLFMIEMSRSSFAQFPVEKSDP